MQVRYAGDDEALLRSAAAFAERNVRDLIVVPAPARRGRTRGRGGLVARLRSVG